MAPTLFLHMFFSCRFDFYPFVDILPGKTNVDRSKKSFLAQIVGWEDVLENVFEN